MRRVLFATVFSAIAALAVSGVASADRTPFTVVCGGETLTLTVTSTTNEHGIAWGVGTISGGTHLIPTSFSFTATDLTTDEVVFSETQMKGRGNAQRNQSTITCYGEPEQATAGELRIPEVDPSDIIELTFTVTAVVKP
jgi:hypothetical protein